jgi:UDP-N-acetylmuramoyl-L-alanyl-D-glutamate--2,6-diaminopimelate ligase
MLRSTLPARTLGELVPHATFSHGKSIACTGCTADLNQVRGGDLFAVGVQETDDSYTAALQAQEQGASALLTEQLLPVNIPQVIVNNVRLAYGTACHALHGNPSRQLPVIGIGGSYGKTTTALLTAAVLNVEKQGVAAVTSLAHCDSVQAFAPSCTTPMAENMSQLLHSAIQQGCSHAVAELSSIGLAERRTAGLELAVAVLTNCRRSPNGRFPNFQAYRACLEQMFTQVKTPGAIVLNADDASTPAMLERMKHPTLTYGIHTVADVNATLLERCASEQTFLLEAGSDSIAVRTRMVGEHHIYNCLAATTVGLLFGMELSEIARGLESVERIPGRMERIECGQSFTVFVDSARCHDTLATALRAARHLARGRVICVAAPPTHESARPLLGKVLEKMANVSIITSGGAANEQSLTRAHEVLDGYEHPSKAHIIPSRDKAISWALEQAQPGDVLLISGKGHKTWSGSQSQTDSNFTQQSLYEIAARELRSKPLVFAYSG